MELSKCSRCGAFHTNGGDVCPKCAGKDNLELSVVCSYYIILYTYFITAFLVSIRDNITACSFISVISVIYLLLYKSDYDTYILIVIGTLSFACFILNKKHLSFISLLIAYNKQIVNKHNNLVDKYGNLVDKYNNLVDKYNNEEINPKGDDITNSVIKGFFVETGKKIGKTILDWF